MTPEFKNRWIAALTDGSFRQATRELINRVSDEEAYHCCLAVAGVLAGFNLEDNRANQLLKPKELKVLGLSYADQNLLANDNDDCPVLTGQYYPAQVIARIRDLPVQVWPKFEFYGEVDSQVYCSDPYVSDNSKNFPYSYVPCPPPAWMAD